MNMKIVTKDKKYQKHVTKPNFKDAGVDPEILKRGERGGGGGTLCQPPWLAGDENFRFQKV